MDCTIHNLSLASVPSGSTLLLTSQTQPMDNTPHIVGSHLPQTIAIGSFFTLHGQEPWLQVQGHCWLPGQSRALGYWVTTQTPLSQDAFPCLLQITTSGFSLAWITLSDSGVQGKRKDTSGPQIPELISKYLPLSLNQGFMLSDDAASIQSLLTHLALTEQFDLIITTGGTGVAPRDVTADITAALVQKRLPGFEQAMMNASLAVTPHAAISRAVAGILGTCLIINLPGSPKGVRENLAPLLPALNHTLDKMHGDPTDCAFSNVP